MGRMSQPKVKRDVIGVPETTRKGAEAIGGEFSKITHSHPAIDSKKEQTETLLGVPDWLSQWSL